MTEPSVRIAMWSGPRNISTAMMRSWGSRGDTFVSDEPFYAHYLRETGVIHPGREEVLASHEADWRKIVAWLTGPTPGGRRVWYQKHMAHHLLPGMDRGWLAGAEFRHALLIRDPGAMLASLSQVTPNPTLEDTGLPQQVELFEAERGRTGRAPPVVDAADVLRDPRGMLTSLCAALGLPFDAAMLAWEPGRRETDGVWARYWYANVERSTGFEQRQEGPKPLPNRLQGLYERCLVCYERLHRERLCPTGQGSAGD
jgi:hypothetical protein